MELGSLSYKILKKVSAINHAIDIKLKQRREAYIYGFRNHDLKARLKVINGGYKGNNKDFKQTVLQYWAQYGLKPKKLWYALYCEGMNSYDPRFIPDPIWFKYILPYFNSAPMVPAYADKGLYSKTINNVTKPDTIVKNVAGYFYDGDGDHLITREEAVRLCEGEEHLIIKPTLGSKGVGIMFYDRDDKSLRIPAIFHSIGANFVVQRIVMQHPLLARLNSSALNTIRIISFHFKGEVFILSAQLRIGSAGSRVDNVSAGGYACAIRQDGWLHEKAVTRKMLWTDETSNGIKLKTVFIPNYEEIKETIKRLHQQLPYFNIIGWDFAVNEEGTPVFIELESDRWQGANIW